MHFPTTCQHCGASIRRQNDYEVVYECGSFMDDDGWQWQEVDCMLRVKDAAIIRLNAILEQAKGENGYAAVVRCRKCGKEFAKFSIESHLSCPRCRRNDNLLERIRRLEDFLEQTADAVEHDGAKALPCFDNVRRLLADVRLAAEGA